MAVINVMKVFPGKQWGADTNTLRTIYTAMIKSRLDYAGQVHDSSPEHLKK